MNGTKFLLMVEVTVRKSEFACSERTDPRQPEISEPVTTCPSLETRVRNTHNANSSGGMRVVNYLEQRLHIKVQWHEGTKDSKEVM